MQTETSNASFLEYGSAYRTPIPQKGGSLIRQATTQTARNYVTQLYCFNCDVFLEIHEGLAALLVAHEPDPKQLQEFSMNHLVRIKAGVFYAVVATTPQVVYDTIVDTRYHLNVVPLAAPYEYKHRLPRIEATNILGHFYRIRNGGYQFKGERHDFFELTYVDTGRLNTEVDHKLYEIGEKEMMIYAPGQWHTQFTNEGQTASYVTILFTMGAEPSVQGEWFRPLVNRVFPYDKKIYTLIRTLVQESTTGIPYMYSLMSCLLSETIIRLLQSQYLAPPKQQEKPVSISRQNYQDDLFQRIEQYINERIYEPLTIADICQHFSLSRSSLQILFKTAVKQTPKKYISDLKLEKACQMLQENRYTISEISLRLGYSSIHYFSNAFNRKYEVSPSEYAKRFYQQPGNTAR